MIDPITQYILEADNSSFAKRASLRIAKPASYVKKTFKKSNKKGLGIHADCAKLKNLADKYGRGKGKCNGGKREYYRQLTKLCDLAYKLQAILADRNKVHLPGRKKQIKIEGQNLKESILETKEKLAQAKSYMTEACRNEMETKIQDREKKRETRSALLKKKLSLKRKK